MTPKTWRTIAGIAILCHIAVPSGLLAQSEDEQLLEEIRAAWQQRADETPALTAEWTMDTNPDAPAGTPEDPEPMPRTQLLEMYNDLIRVEERHRYYDIDGGPRGSMSWQTGSTLESYDPENGWRQLTGTSVSEYETAYINRLPAAFPGLAREYLCYLWYRGTSDAVTGAPFAEWAVCHDSRFGGFDPNIVTLIRDEPGDRVTLLYLERSRDYLPVSSRLGKRPPDNQPMLNYEECQAVLRPGDSGEPPFVPVSWVKQRFVGGSAAYRPEICTLSEIRTESSTEFDHYFVEFPAGQEPADFATWSMPSPSAVPSTAKLNGDSETSKHPLHWGYWSAFGFGGLLLIALYLKFKRSPV